MTRKQRSRQRPKRRKRTTRVAGRAAPSRASGGLLGWSGRSGWGRFGAGILIGLALGIVAVLYAGSAWMNHRPAADQVIAAASPESRDPSTGARVNIETPEIVESAGAQPSGEEAAANPTPVPIQPPQVVETTNPAPQPTAAPAPNPAPQVAGNEPAPAPTPVATVAVPLTPTLPLTLGPGGQPAWLQNAVAFSVPHGRPIIAIVLDDVGVNKSHAEQAIALPPEITLSFMTYANHVDDMAKRARAKGHELMVHVPMEPLSNEIDPGPKALRVGYTEAEILERLRWGLGQFDGYVGINNHMGSRFTQDERGMRVVIEELRRRNLLFLDSKTISTSVGDRLAAQLGVAHVSRDVFLDDDMSSEAVLRQLALAERVARENGQAIAIGHPHPATIAAIKAWLPRAKAEGFIIAPLSTVAKLRLGASG